MKYMAGLFCVLCLTYTQKLNSQHTLTITEIHYNSDSTRNTGDWFELYNYGSADIDISLFRIRDSSATGLYLVPSGTILGAQQYLVFCSDLSRFDAHYSISNRMGNLGYGLNNKSDGIRIFDASNNLILEVFYTDSLPWPPGADGYGRTLEIINTSLDPSLPENWRTGCVLGSPGTAFTPCTSETLVVSEINYKSSPLHDAGDWFEIRNIGSTSVDIGNFRVRDNKNENMYQIPSNTILAPQASLVVFDNPTKFNNQFPWVTNKTGPFFFNLSGGGDCIRLYNANDKVIFSICYNDDDPWSELPDGNGYTLEADTNFSFSRDVNHHNSWFAGCPKGSPGVKFNPDCNSSIESVSTFPFIIYPNPTRDYFRIDSELSTLQTVTMIDMHGKISLLQSANDVYNVQSYPAGVYIIAIDSNHQKYYCRITILP